MVNNINKEKITDYLNLLKREGIIISDEQKKKLEEINHLATSNWLIFNSLSLKQVEDERPINNSYGGDINVCDKIYDWKIEENVPEQFFQAIFEEEATGEMAGDEDHPQPVLRKVGFRCIEPINNDFFIALNRQLREAHDEAEVPRGGDGNFTYEVVGVGKIDRDTGNQVWTHEPYYLEDENGKVIGEATQPDGKKTGFWPYFKLLNTSNNTLIRFPQRMERVPTDSFGIEHEEFEELIKELVEDSDGFADGIHRLQFRGEKNSWPRPDTREWIAVRKDLIEGGYTEYITSIYEDGEKNWKKRTSLADLLNIPEIRDSITGDNNNHQPELVSVEQIEEFNDLLIGLEFSTNYRKFYREVLGSGLERQRKLQKIDEVLFIKVRNKVNDLKDLKKLVLGDTEEIKNDKEEFNDKEIKKRVELVELMKELLKKEKKQNPNNNHENDKQGNEQVSELEKAKFVAIQRIRQELTKEPEITEQELEEDRRRWRMLINNSNEIEKINDIREKLLAYIFEKRKEKSSEKKVAELVERGERIGDYEELKVLVGKIEEFRGSPIYLSLKDRIKNLKVKLASNDLQSYQQTNVKMIEEELLKCGVKTEEIDQAAQKAFDKLNTVKDLPAEEIDNSKEIISVSVRTKSAEKQLDRFIKQFDDSHDKIAKKKAKKKILQFISNKNTFNQKAAEMRKEKLDAILGNHNQELDPSPSFPWTMVISIFLLTAFVIGISIYWKRKRRK